MVSKSVTQTAGAVVGWAAIVLCLVWLVLALVRFALLFGYAFDPNCPRPLLVLASLLPYVLPIALFVYSSRRTSGAGRRLAITLTGLTGVLISEVMLALSIGANAASVIACECVIVGSMLMTAGWKRRREP